MTSVVITTKNEADNIRILLDSLANQQGLDELVIVDGGSTDETVNIIREFAMTAAFPINLIVEPGANIARGRNIAIKNSKGDLIAVTDAGCGLSNTWLAALVAPLKEDPKVEMVAGFFKATDGTLAHNILSAVTIPPLYEIRAGRFLPSSRSIAFRKSLWERVGGYPEWLPICEDLVFDLKLKRADVREKFAPEAWVVWFVRGSWEQYFWQYYRYARGDGHALLWPRRHMIRYGTYLMALLLILLSVFVNGWFVLLLIAGFFAYMSKFWRRFFHHYPSKLITAYIIAMVIIPLLVIEGDIAKMIGYPIGRWQRHTGKIKPEAF